MKLKATRFHYVKLDREFLPKINRILEGKKNPICIGILAKLNSQFLPERNRILARKIGG